MVRLKVLRQIVREELKATKPTFHDYLPDDHKLGMKVTKGGSSCSDCSWVGKDGKTCGNEFFQGWHEDVEGAEEPAKLPAPADEYCCDLWHPAKK